jgi:sigma-B regulation protein RsbU (phosphoserine phosphatase)
VSVRNQGAIIPESLMATLFEPMIRGTNDRNARSVGLGLFIVREIARSHGGNVTVCSNTEEGTTFEVFFPQIQS